MRFIVTSLAEKSFISHKFREIGLPISLGRLNVTTSGEDPFEVELVLGYDVDIRFDNETVGIKTLNSAPTPYSLVIENVGTLSDGQIVVDLKAT